LGGKAVCAGMGTIYKSTGDQPATVSHRLQWIIKYEMLIICSQYRSSPY